MLLRGLEIDDRVIAAVQPGKVVRVKGRLWYIRAIVDSEMVVYRVWCSRPRRAWDYEIAWLYDFQIMYKFGALTLGR